MTPAIIELEQAKAAFDVLEYQTNKQAHHYGEQAAQALNLNPAQVFKTLLVSTDLKSNPIAVALVPVNQQLNLKLLAKHLKLKKLQLADPNLAQRSTGYLVGGMSPLGQKKKLPTVIDNSCTEFDNIYVSAGQRGLQLCLAPSILMALSNGELCNIK